MIRLGPGAPPPDAPRSVDGEAEAAPRPLVGRLPDLPALAAESLRNLQGSLSSPELEAQFFMLGRSALVASTAALVGAHTLFGFPGGALAATDAPAVPPPPPTGAEDVIPSQAFPIGGGEYNIGWDPKWSVFDQADGPRHNSDFSRTQTDANHRHGHWGVDIFGPRGAPIVAPVKATVVAVGTSRIGGHYVSLKAGNRRFYFAHLDAHAEGLKVGQTVMAGEALGTLGDTGKAKGTAPHLHFEMKVDGQKVDPFDFLMELRPH